MQIIINLKTLTALHIFLIGVAVGIINSEDKEINKNRSMIIHPHNETDACKIC